MGPGEEPGKAKGKGKRTKAASEMGGASSTMPAESSAGEEGGEQGTK